jgi:hypothetical protein
MTTQPRFKARNDTTGTDRTTGPRPLPCSDCTLCGGTEEVTITDIDGDDGTFGCPVCIQRLGRGRHTVNLDEEVVRHHVVVPKGPTAMTTTRRFVAIMGEVYAATPAAWERYLRTWLEKGEAPAAGRGFRRITDDCPEIIDWSLTDVAGELEIVEQAKG